MKKLINLLTIALTLSFTACSEDGEIEVGDIQVTTKSVELTEATISFSKVDGALMYDVDLAKKGQEFENLISISMEQTLESTFKLLDADCEYEAKITALNDNGQTIGEGTTSFTTKAAVAALVGQWENTSGTYNFAANAKGTFTSANGESKKIMWEAEEVALEAEGDLTIRTFIGDYKGTSTEETVKYIYYGVNEAMRIDGSIFYPVTE